LFSAQSGETALHVAARYGNVDVVTYLCSIKANPDLSDRVRTSIGLSSIHYLVVSTL
jgi:ankyrin repeat protein